MIANFNAVAANATGCQWQASTDGGATFADVTGATSANHTTGSTPLADSGTRVDLADTRSLPTDAG